MYSIVVIDTESEVSMNPSPSYGLNNITENSELKKIVEYGEAVVLFFTEEFNDTKEEWERIINMERCLHLHQRYSHIGIVTKQ